MGTWASRSKCRHVKIPLGYRRNWASSSIIHWRCLSLFLACFFWDGNKWAALRSNPVTETVWEQSLVCSTGPPDVCVTLYYKGFACICAHISMQDWESLKKTILYSAWMQRVKYNGVIPLHQGVRCIRRTDFFLALSHHSDCNQTFQSPNYKASWKKGEAEDLEWLMWPLSLLTRASRCPCLLSPPFIWELIRHPATPSSSYTVPFPQIPQARQTSAQNEKWTEPYAPTECPANLVPCRHCSPILQMGKLRHGSRRCRGVHREHPAQVSLLTPETSASAQEPKERCCMPTKLSCKAMSLWAKPLAISHSSRLQKKKKNLSAAMNCKEFVSPLGWKGKLLSTKLGCRKSMEGPQTFPVAATQRTRCPWCPPRTAHLTQDAVRAVGLKDQHKASAAEYSNATRRRKE